MKAPNDHQEGVPVPKTNASAPEVMPQPASAAPPEALNEDERPTPPRIPRVRKRSGSFARRQSSAPLTPPTPPPQAPIPPTPTPAAPEPGLADLEWMPPVEDRVARFLSDVAEIEAPQPREREASAPPPFQPPFSTSPEEAERKKARAEPFLSEVLATPMAPPPRAPARKRWRRLLFWLVVIVVLLLLALIAMKVAIPHIHFLGF